jgi:hypothetical protein
MAFAQGSRSELALVAESTFGTTPATPTLTRIPFKTHSLALTKERLQGADIYADRMQRVDRHGNRTANGTIEVDLRRGDYDTLLESLFLSSFDSNDEIEIGTTMKFFSIEDRALDINQYRLFKGMTVNSATFNIAPNQMVQTTFDMLGKNMVQSGATAANTMAGPGVYEPFDTYNGALFEGGTSSSDASCSVSALQFTLNNGLALDYAVLCTGNESTAANISYGMATLEGTLTVYYEDDAFIDKFLDEVESELSITVDDTSGTNSYTFYMPRIKYNGANVPVANPQSRLIELPFVALRDASEGTLLRLTRTA